MEADPIRTVKVNATFNYKLGDQIKSGENHGTLVFKGFFNGTIPIALKRYQKVDENTIKDVAKNLDVLSSPENKHPNFIRYYGHATDDNFSYLATELCECSVADIIDPKKKIKAHEKTIYFEAIVSSLPKKEILRQSSEAVSFLHRPQWNMIHRNLHPDNFLIACVDPNKNYFLIKLTDFQLSKSIEKNPQNTGTLNKEGWVAPESFKDNIELDNKVDAFILGCYFFYVLSGGTHPFGRGVVNQRTRIKDENDKVYQDSWDGKPEWNIDQANLNEQEEAKRALKLIKDLIKYNPDDRKAVDNVLKSSYFLLESYNIYDQPSSPIPGLCVIICQDKFHNPMSDVDYKFDYSGTRQEGVGLDARKLGETFKSFGYDILSFKNLRAAQIKDWLSSEYLAKQASKSLKKYASLVVCLLGHGDKGVLHGVDGVSVSLNAIQYDAFNDQACPDLKGKPKIFIVLACQGSRTQMIQNERLNHLASFAYSTEELSIGSFMAVPFVDEKQSLAPINRLSNSLLESLPPVYDFIRLVSTIEEFTTQFEYGTGSVFIQSLCDALSNEYKDVTNPEKDEANKRDLAQLFTQVVIPIVGRSGGKTKQTPEFRSSLVKTIRFRHQRIHGQPLQGEYNGVTDDESFKHARNYREALLPNYTKKRIGYEHLLMTVYGEASKKPEDIQRAIAWVIFNRYKKFYRPQWGIENMTRVCMATNQFKCWVGKENIIMSDTDARNAIELWLPTAFDDGSSPNDPTGGSTYFNKPADEGFMRHLTKTVEIGSYQFYKDP